MTALVTGATGFIGSHVTDLLLAGGEEPRVLVRPGDSLGSLAERNVDIRTADINDRARVSAALRGVDRVLHCAARTGPWGPASEYERANVRGLENLVRAASLAGVQRIVHVSSITVHGIDIGGEADETAPFRAEPNPYSQSKVAGERLLERLIPDQRVPVTIVRPGWVYGPGDRASFARLARRIESGQMVMIGSGENHLPLVYVRDAARGILLASEAAGVEGRSYLLVNDEPVTQRGFLTAIAAELDAPVPTRRIPYRLAVILAAGAEKLGQLARRSQPPPVTRYGIQLLGGENRFIISRARRELGFSPQVDLAEGVWRSVDWYRASYEGSDRAEVRA
jgi:2-alkyl-3-oxoalkanoate reductase